MKGRTKGIGLTAAATILLGVLGAWPAAPHDAPRLAYHLRVVRVAGTSEYRGAALGCGRTCGRPILVPAEEVWGTPAQLEGLAQALGGERADAVTGFIILPGPDGTAHFEAAVYPGETSVDLSFSARVSASPNLHDLTLTVKSPDGGEPLAEARVLTGSERTVAIAAPSPIDGEWLVLAVTTLDPAAAEARVTSGAPIDRPGGQFANPVAVDKIAPTYTPQARRERREGKVILNAVIDTEGRVRAPMVLSVDPGLEDLAASAVEAVEQWRFRPGTRDGTPVPTYFTIVVEFRLR